MMKLDRVYHHYLDWEEVDFNMWGSVKDRKLHLDRAIKFTSDHKRYGRFMNRVVREWSKSCENALTDYAINRRAWVGHAATALALGCPEDITREAWRYLTDEQQLLANKEADGAIKSWEYDYIKSRGLDSYVGESMLFEWDT